MTIRDSLAGRRHGVKLLDMEKIYWQIDMGMTVEEVAEEWGVSVSTLYRRHRSYQKEARLLKSMETEENLPPLPGDLPAGQRTGSGSANG